LWLLPSRRRPASLARFFDAYRATSGSTPGMVLVDTADYADNCALYDALELPPGWFVHYTHGATQGDKIAEVWDEVKDCAWTIMAALFHRDPQSSIRYQTADVEIVRAAAAHFAPITKRAGNG
jgi:hypothetical protein